jgi:voltage-gated potassium channel Kch
VAGSTLKFSGKRIVILGLGRQGLALARFFVRAGALVTVTDDDGAIEIIASPAVVERIAGELFEDANAQNIKLLEVRFSPDWAFSGHGLDWDAALDGILRAKQRAVAQFGIAIGLIAITSRSRGVSSCEKTVDWAIRRRDHLHGVDLADGEAQYPFSPTSAAAPHAAAVAALVWSAKTSLTNVQVYNILKTTALDNMASGVDRDGGWGIVMALKAVQAAQK